MKNLARISFFIALSVLIHLGLGDLAFSDRSTPVEYKTISVRILKNPAPKVVKAPEPKPKPRPKPKPNPKPTPEPKAEPVPDPEPLPDPEPEPAVETEIEPQPESEQVEETALATLDNEKIQDLYRQKVCSIIYSNRLYPRRARRMKLEGTVSIGFTIGPDGIPHKIKIEKSSGISILDRSTVKTISRCVFPSPPGGRPIDLTIPITYLLTEGS